MSMGIRYYESFILKCTHCLIRYEHGHSITIFQKQLLLHVYYHTPVIETRKSVDGEPSHIPALIKANRIEASYFLAYVAKYG